MGEGDFEVRVRARDSRRSLEIEASGNSGRRPRQLRAAESALSVSDERTSLGETSPLGEARAEISDGGWIRP